MGQGCCGHTRTAIHRDTDAGADTALVATIDCDQCGHGLQSAVGLGLLDQPSIVAFLREQVVDAAETPFWQFPWCVSDDQTAVRSSDPWRIEVTVEGAEGGPQLRVTVDGRLSIQETARV